MTRLAAVCLFTALSVLSPLAEAARRHATGQPGAFDYYVLSLSWSPEYCHSQADTEQCSGERHFGFVVHGLWPQYRNGSWPEYCANVPGPINPARMLDIMPSLQLIQHEWRAHGTCSGLSQTDYFNLVRRAYNAVHIPSRFVAPSQHILISGDEIRREFERANPGLPRESLSIDCKGGKYLSEVRVCLGKRLEPVPCSASRTCNASQLRLAPVR
jgi:ribonuclease T2